MISTAVPQLFSD